MAGFTKLHECIIRSSIWNEDYPTRIVFVAFLAMANASGNVIGVRRRLAASANVSIPEYDRAIERLTSPDPESKTPDHEGRRILAIPGGWFVVNYHLYRAFRDPSKRREQNREAKRRQRERERKAAAECQTIVSQSHPNAEAEAYSNTNTPLPPSGLEGQKEEKPTQSNAVRHSPTHNLSVFESFWGDLPQEMKKDKPRARKWWLRAKPGKELIVTMRQGLAAQLEERRQYAVVGVWHARWPNAATWLNNARWEDEITSPAGETTQAQPTPNPIGPDGLTDVQRTMKQIEEKYGPVNYGPEDTDGA